MDAGLFVTPTPIYNLVAHNATEAQEIQLIHQIQAHQMSPFTVYLLAIAFHFPGNDAQKLAFFHFLLSLHLPIPTDTELILMIIFVPFLIACIFLLFVFIATKTIPHIPAFFSGLMGKITHKKKEEIVLLELRFPSSTTKSAYATEQLYKLLHTLSRKKEGWLRGKKTYSLEIVATRNDGIRYIVVVPKKEKELFSRSLVAFLPQIKIQEVSEYMPTFIKDNESTEEPKVLGLAEFKLSSDFTIPLHTQKVLDEHDAMSFLTGNMTHLADGEKIIFQIVVTPILKGTHGKQLKWMNNLKNRIYNGKPIEPVVKKTSWFPGLPSLWFLLLGLPVYIGIFLLKVIVTMIGAFIRNDTKGLPFFEDEGKQLQQILNPYEQELATVVKDKMSQELFETSIRVLVVTNTEEELNDRIDGLIGSLGQFGSTHQELVMKGNTFGFPRFNTRITQFKERLLSSGFGNAENPILSLSELTDLYHLPNTNTTKTEDLVKSKETTLPAPLSFKQERKDSVVIGKNLYADRETVISLSYKERKEATYMIGGSNMGKTTILANMIYQDMVNNKGLCVIDPHGDLTSYLLSIVPENRKNDVVYINPLDQDCITGINILAPRGVDVSSQENQDRITSSVLSIFQKQTEKEYWGPRLEHILRNALLTSFLIDTPTKIPTLYTIQMLLTDKIYRKRIIEKLKDPILKRFWDKEFALYADGQVASVISPITNKLGKFITNHLSQKILLQQESTIDMAEIMNSGKILLVNLSKGALGEDRAFFFGTMITSLIQLAAYGRESIPEKQRRDFYLYIDEFQNFATSSFAEIVSETRKYHVYPILSHQNTAQITDKDLLKVILGNVGTLIALRTSPSDEEVVLPFFAPEVKKGNLVNLKPHQFVIKVRNEKLEDAFTGETIVLDVTGEESTAKDIIANSQKQYAKPEKDVEEELQKLFALDMKTSSKKSRKPKRRGKSTKKV